MGWENPEIPWRELERRLSGRPQAPWHQLHGDGGDSPAWSRKRPAYDAGPLRPAQRRPSPTPSCTPTPRSATSTARRRPRSWPRRRSGSACESLTLTDHDGMYGVVRFAEAAEAHGLATGFGAELSLDVPRAEHPGRALDRAPGSGSPTRPARICSPWPATPPATPACAGRSASRSGAAAPRAVRSTTSTSSPTRPTVTGWCSPAAARAPVRAALDARRRSTGGPRALDRLVARFGRDNVAVELTYALDPLADERYDALAAARRRAAARRSSPPPPRTTTARRAGRWPRRWPRCGPAAASTRSTAGCRLGRPAPAQRRGDGRPVRPLADAVANAARLAKELAFPLVADRPRPAAVPVPARAHRDELPARAHLRRRGRAVRPASRTRPRPTR